MIPKGSVIRGSIRIWKKEKRTMKDKIEIGDRIKARGVSEKGLVVYLMGKTGYMWYGIVWRDKEVIFMIQQTDVVKVYKRDKAGLKMFNEREVIKVRKGLGSRGWREERQKWS